jgi:hypothetical protein
MTSIDLPANTADAGSSIPAAKAKQNMTRPTGRMVLSSMAQVV